MRPHWYQPINTLSYSWMQPLSWINHIATFKMIMESGKNQQLPQSLQLCFKRIPWSKWLSNNRDFFLTVLEAEKSKVQVPADPCLVVTYFLVHSGCLFIVSSNDRKGKRVLQKLFCKGTSSIHEGSTFII
jgi:hypothetical protein